MKKLLIATDNFLPRWDGVARVLIEILPYLSKEFDVTIICPNNGKIQHDLNADIVKINLSSWQVGDYQIPTYNSKVVKDEVKKADIVFSQTLGPIGSTAIRVANRYNKKIACYTHNIEWELVPLATGYGRLKRFLGVFVRLFTKYHYNKVDLMFVPSKTIGENLEYFNIKSKKEVVHLGVNTNVFKPRKELTKTQKTNLKKYEEELGLQHKYVIGMHGRLAREKNVVTLLRAFKWIHKKHENAHLLIVADGLKSIGNKLRGKNHITWIKRSDTVQKELQLMNVYVTTSLTETTSLSTLEAMSCALPIISTPVGFVKEYIKDGVNGLLFEFKSSYELQKKLSLLINNESLAKNMGEKARKKVVDNFQWKNTAHKLLQHLTQL